MDMVMVPRGSTLMITRVKRKKGTSIFHQIQEIKLIGRSLPLLLLALSVGTSLLSGIVLGNHSKLVECEQNAPLRRDCS